MRRTVDSDTRLLDVAMEFARQGRGVYVRFSHGEQFRVDSEGVPFTDQATDKQLSYIARLADEKGAVAPDGPLSKEQASEIISSLQAGTYDPDKWVVPF